MNVYGQLIAAQLENLSSAPAGVPAGRVYFDTTLHMPRYYDDNGTTWRTLADLTSTQTIAAKTLTTVASITLVASGAIDWAAGSVSLGASIGANTLTLAGSTSTVKIAGTTLFSAQAEVHFGNSDDSHYVGFKGAASIAANKVWTLPNADGSSGQVLKTDGSLTLSWVTALTDPMSARGDIVVRNASNVTARLGIGAAGTVLKGGTDVAWATIVDADVDAAAAIAGSKLVAATGSVAGAVTTSAQTFAGAKTFTNGVLLGNAASSGTGVTSNNLTTSSYEEATLVTTVTNFTATPAITLKMVRNGSLITCAVVSTVTDASKTNTTNPTLAAKLPTNMRPPVTYYCPTWIKNNGTLQIGIVQVDSDGTVTWLTPTAGSWTSAAAAQVVSCPFSFTAT